MNGVFSAEVTANVPKMLEVMCWLYVLMMLISIVSIFPAEETLENPAVLNETNTSYGTI